MKICGISALNNILPYKVPVKTEEKPQTGGFDVQKNLSQIPSYYGRDLIAKKPVSFGKCENSPPYQLMADDDFYKLKLKIKKRLATLPENVSKKINPEKLDKINILVAYKILSSDRILENKGIMSRAQAIISESKKIGTAKGRIILLDKYINDDKLNNNDKLKKAAGDIISATYTKEGGEAKSKVIDCILSNDILCESKDFMKEAKGILSFVPTNEIANVEISMMRKLTSDERLYGNKSFFAHAGKITHKTYTKENAEAKFGIIDKILSSEKYFKNNDYMNYAGELLSCPTRDTQMKLADKFLFDERIYGKEGLRKYTKQIIEKTDSQEIAEVQVFAADKFVSDEVLSSDEQYYDYFPQVLPNTETETQAENYISVIKRVTTDENLSRNKKFGENEDKIIRHASFPQNFETDKEILDNFDLYSKSVENQRKKVLAAPELYLNGEIETEEEAKKTVNDFFDDKYPELLTAAYVFDGRTVNGILRSRFEEAGDCLSDLSYRLNKDDKEILKSLNDTLKSDGKPPLPGEKLDFIHTLCVCNDLGCDKNEITSMIEEKRLDTAKINLDLYTKLLEKCGLTPEEIKAGEESKAKVFDKKYVHLLAAETMKSIAEENNDFVNIIKACALNKDFKSYIGDKSNKYGIINDNTRKMFAENGLNYDAWLNPDKKSNIKVLIRDKNSVRLGEISDKITENVEKLRQTPAKRTVDKQFKDFITDDKFTIPPAISGSKEKLQNLLKNIQTQFGGIFRRAEANKDSPEKKAVANSTLEVRNSFNECEKELEATNDANSPKSSKLDLTIKMWDRVPQKDIFQGNYSTCCIGMNRRHGNSMSKYLLYCAFNMIEMCDNRTGKPIGNALCFFVNDNRNKPSFVVDNVEIKNSVKLTEETGIELRDKITEYASSVAEKVTGKKDTPIYINTKYNDIPCGDLPRKKQNVTFIGKADENEIYLDLYGGKTSLYDKTRSVETFKLK